jgi:hypothetical protein
VAAYAFEHDGALCRLHTHNRAFSLSQTSYIEEGAVTQVKHNGQYRYKRVKENFVEKLN